MHSKLHEKRGIRPRMEASFFSDSQAVVRPQISSRYFKVLFHAFAGVARASCAKTAIKYPLCQSLCGPLGCACVLSKLVLISSANIKDAFSSVMAENVPFRT